MRTNFSQEASGIICIACSGDEDTHKVSAVLDQKGSWTCWVRSQSLKSDHEQTEGLLVLLLIPASSLWSCNHNLCLYLQVMHFVCVFTLKINIVLALKIIKH